STSSHAFSRDMRPPRNSTTWSMRKLTLPWWPSRPKQGAVRLTGVQHLVHQEVVSVVSAQGRDALTLEEAEHAVVEGADLVATVVHTVGDTHDIVLGVLGQGVQHSAVVVGGFGSEVIRQDLVHLGARHGRGGGHRSPPHVKPVASGGAVR